MPKIQQTSKDRQVNDCPKKIATRHYNFQAVKHQTTNTRISKEEGAYQVDTQLRRPEERQQPTTFRIRFIEKTLPK